MPHRPFLSCRGASAVIAGTNDWAFRHRGGTEGVPFEGRRHAGSIAPPGDTDGRAWSFYCKPANFMITMYLKARHLRT